MLGDCQSGIKIFISVIYCFLETGNVHQKAERALKYATLGAGKTGLGGMNTAGDLKMGREEQRCEQIPHVLWGGQALLISTEFIQKWGPRGDYRHSLRATQETPKPSCGSECCWPPETRALSV